jgi:hypothetical protein
LLLLNQEYMRARCQLVAVLAKVVIVVVIVSLSFYDIGDTIHRSIATRSQVECQRYGFILPNFLPSLFESHAE